MTIELTSLCHACTNRDDSGDTCTAFPSGIPRAILTLGADHTKAYPGDGGVRFDLADGPAAQAAYDQWRDVHGAPLTAAARRFGRSRDDVLADASQLALAYANTVADTIPVDPKDKRPGYAAHHHLFSAPPDVERAYLELAGDLLPAPPKGAK